MRMLSMFAVSAVLAVAIAANAFAQQYGPARSTHPGQGMTSGWKADNDPNATPEQAVNKGQIDENSVKSLLQSKGYNDVRNLKRAGGDYTAEANKDGRDVRVTVDGRSGSIDEANR